MAIPKFSREQILAEIARREQDKQNTPIQRNANAPINQFPPQNQPRMAVQKPSNNIPTPPQRTNIPAAESHIDSFAVDKKTGKRYKKINKQSKEATAATTVAGLLSHMELDDGIEGFASLNDSAELFLGHLRVAPNKEELARLREMKLRQIRKQNEEYKKTLEAEAIKEEKENQLNDNNTGW